MGYYVRGDSYKFMLKAGQEDAIRAAIRELNTHDELKNGGQSKGGVTVQKWFSWMNDFDYDSDFTTVELLERLGFDVTVNEDGDITNLFYDGKTGQEDLFLATLAPFIEDGSSIDWQGEEDERWRWVFEGGEMFHEVEDSEPHYTRTGAVKAF
jgi:hypothetical protein